MERERHVLATSGQDMPTNIISGIFTGTVPAKFLFKFYKVEKISINAFDGFIINILDNYLFT